MARNKSIWLTNDEESKIEKFCRENKLMREGKPEYSRAIRILISMAMKGDSVVEENLRAVIERYKELLFQAQEENIKLSLQLQKVAPVVGMEIEK